MGMNEIVISSPAEILGIPKNKPGTILLMLGYLFPSSIQINKFFELKKFIEHNVSYLLFGINRDYVIGEISNISVSYDHYYSVPIPRAVDMLVDVTEGEFQKTILSTSQSKNVISSPLQIKVFGKAWDFYELWFFNGVILKQQKESIQDLKNIGVGLLTILGKKWTK